MTISVAVRGALQSNLDNVSGLPSSVAYEGVEFDPSPGTAFARVSVINTTKTPDMPGATAYHEGIFQIDLYYPHGFGTNAIEQASDAVRAAYGAGTVLFNSGVAVTLYRTESRGPAIKEADWIRQITDVYWRANATEQ